MKHMNLRLAALMCVLALLVSCLPSALAASYPYETTVMESVNLRAKASSSAALVKKLAAGDTVKVLGSSGEWYRLQSGSHTGYAMKMYVDGTAASPDATPAPGMAVQAAPAISTYPYDTTVISNVKLRKTAATDGKVIVMIPAGEMVTVYERTSNGFAKVKYKGKTGYAADTNINIADIPAPTPVPTTAPKAGSEKYDELKQGASGTAVKALQSALAELGYMDENGADGKFGAKTEAALKTFQKRNGLEQNGIASAELQLLMYEGTPKDTKGYRQYVKTVAPAAGAVIRKGSTGEAVTKLQNRLRELGYYNGLATGVCDDETVAAIKLFEGKHGLTADGEMSGDDQNVLYGATVMAVSVQVAPTPAPTQAVPDRTLRRGDQGEDVKSVQQRLIELGYYSGKITGTYNEGTELAVKDFQKKSSITADGVCGPVTRTVLYGTNAVCAKATAIPDVAENAETAYPEITRDNVTVIRAGTMGEVVLRLQTRLQELGYYNSRRDGVYLTEDINAVRLFQKTNGLTVDGTAGYNTQSLLYSTAAQRCPDKEETQNTTTSLRYGSQGDTVAELQNKLISLGYLSGSADGKFGINTKKAVIAFQKANKLTADGIAGTATLEALNGKNPVSNKVESSTSLKIGMASDAVKELQNRLIALGYLAGKADGVFGTKTSLAVIAFQTANKLTADGIAGSKTIAKINSTTAVSQAENSAPAAAPSVGYGQIAASMVRYANWYNEVKAICRKYPNVTVYDFTTGISWHLNIFSCGAHADAEPISAEDTANMNRAFGGKTTWTPKAVWVVFSDGSVYMASTHNTPHDVQHNTGNNFAGHLCIHFPRTQAQVEAIGSYATSHQKAIDQGWEATQMRAR